MSLAPAVSVKKAACRSDIGSVRKHNEDGFLALNKASLYAVADGTNGPEAPRAALTALKELAGELQGKCQGVLRDPTTGTRLDVGRALQEVFAKANGAVQDAGERIHERRIATTLAALTIAGPYAFVAHVGNSRVYLLRAGELRRLTNDHTLAALQLRRGDIDEAEFKDSPFKKTLSQALGMSAALDVDTAELRLMPGDLLLLTTNGLTHALTEAEITKCLMVGEPDLDTLADGLMKAVKDAGAPDNTTFILVATEGTAPTGGKVRQRVEDLEPLVQKAFLYAGLSTSEWLQVAPYLEQREVRAGDVVCAPGGGAIGFSVIASGAARLTQPGGETRDLHPGEAFGQLSLATDEPSMDKVEALAPTLLYLLSRARFQELVRVNPALGGRLTLSLLESLGNRLGTLTTRLAIVLEAVQGRL